MSDITIIVLRTDDYAKNWLSNELKSGKLRQGWGIPGLQLKDDGQPVEMEEWIKRYQKLSKEYWNTDADEKEARKRYWILHTMLDLADGDIIVIPKLPNYGMFTITRVQGGYEYDNRTPHERNGYDDYRHTLNIDIGSIREFSYMSSAESKLVQSKVRGYQSAVNNVYNEEFIDAIKLLVQRDSDVEGKKFYELFDEINKPLMKKCLENLNKLPNKDLENLVAETFLKGGFALVRRNYYDKEGGDADAVLTADVPILTEIEEISTKVYLQVKKRVESIIVTLLE